MSSAIVDHETSIFERLVVSPESAEAILSIRFTPEDEERMRGLMDRSNKGTINQEEIEEMEAYSRIGSFLAILQAKARLYVSASDT